MVVADTAFAHLDLAGTYQNGSFPDALWVISIFLVMLAAHLAGDRGEPKGSYVSPRRRVSIVPFAAVFAGLGLLVYQTTDPSGRSLLPLSIGIFVVTGLVVARQVTLQRDVTQLIHELEYLAGTDQLTGLASRRAFFERANQLVARANDSVPCAVLISDLDSFKDVNDVHGHAIGDAVLCAAARHCREAVGPGGVVGRIGGDEFAFVLRLAALVEADASVIANGTTIRTEITFGIACSNGSATLDELLLTADLDLYRAKAQGRNNRTRLPRAPLRTSPIRGTTSPES